MEVSKKSSEQSIRFSSDLEQTLYSALGEAQNRWHEYATIEHLLLALVDDPQASAVLDACGVSRNLLKNDIRSYLDNELKTLDIRSELNEHVGDQPKDTSVKPDPTPTSGFQRVVQRSILHAQSSGREEVNGANVLVALFSERESYAVYFLNKQEMSRIDAITYISHGVGKNRASEQSLGAEPNAEVSERINRVFKDDLDVVADVIPHTPVLSTPKIADKITELAINLIEQSAPTALADLGSRPLITIGIYGPWGSGKSTLLRAVGHQMSASGFVTVHINTWKWDGDEDIYSFMNRELLRSLSNISGVKWRVFLVKVLLKIRSNIKRWGIWGAVAAGVLTGVWVMDWKAVTATQLAKGTIAGVVTTGIVAALAKPIISLIEKLFLIEPTNIDARQSLSKSYRYLDFVRRFTLSKRRRPIVFLFDDLDRCDNKIVVDFVRSIHSLTSDGSLCVVACDEEFTSAAIYSQYKDVADYLDEGKNFGRRFLEKIIQVPFRLPEVFKEDLREIGLMPLPINASVAKADSSDLSAQTDDTPKILKDLGEEPPSSPVSEARLWEICGSILALVVEPAGLEIRQAKMLSNMVKLYSMIFPPVDEVSAERLAAFLVVNYIDANWIPCHYLGASRRDSPLDAVEAELRNKLGDDVAALTRMYRTLGFRRGWQPFPVTQTQTS